VTSIYLLCSPGLVTEQQAEDGSDWNKAVRRKINYSFRILISFVHYLLAYLEYSARGIDSDDIESGATDDGGGHFSSADASSSTDDSTNYHNVRKQDKFFYIHAALLAFSLMLEVAASFLCKKKDRRTFSLAAASRARPPPEFSPSSSTSVSVDSTGFVENMNPLQDLEAEDKTDDDRL
jgi:hypothetical protein